MMRFMCGIILLLTISSSYSQQLTADSIERMAQSLVEQQVLTLSGKAALIRFSQGQPLHIYDGLPKTALTGIKPSVYFAEGGFIDYCLGTRFITKALLDSLRDFKNYPWNDSREQLEEEYFLLDKFPCRRDLYQFIGDALDFYRYNYTSDLSYDTTRRELVARLGTWFGSALQAVMADSAREFRVSMKEDTEALQEERVTAFQPYLHWVRVFQQAGFLPQDDSVLLKHYSNGENIYATVSHHRFLDELGNRITYLEKYPYYKQQQLRLLDSLEKVAMINAASKQQIISRYRPYTLLAADDIFPYYKQAVPIYRSAEITPYDYIPENQYGKIAPVAIKTVMENVLGKISQKLFPVNFSPVEVHKKAPDANGLYPHEEYLVLSRSAKIMDARVEINHRLYREVIDEKEFESWIRPENFQFLNHLMEDRQDNRRFFFILPYLFTGYEPQQADTLFIALLTEKQVDILQSRYLFKRLEGCYNGSPGDYDYCVYPGEYFDPASRLSYEQISRYVDECAEKKLIHIKDKAEKALLLAALREQNPHTIEEVFPDLPASPTKKE